MSKQTNGEVKSAMTEARDNRITLRRLFDRFVMWWKVRYCHHEFRLRDLSKTGIPEPEKPTGVDADYTAYWHEYYYGDWNTKRVRWPCSKCGKVFYAHCGLDISPQHGPIVGDS